MPAAAPAAAAAVWTDTFAPPGPRRGGPPGAAPPPAPAPAAAVGTAPSAPPAQRRGGLAASPLVRLREASSGGPLALSPEASSGTASPCPWSTPNRTRHACTHH